MSSKTYLKAVQFLARRSHSREELRRKLRAKFPKDKVEEALARLEELGYLNDTNFAEERAHFLRNHKNWGNLRISLDLQRLGVDAKIGRTTLEQLEEESSEKDALKRAIGGWKRIFGNPRTASKLKKLYNHCLRLGYSPESIRQELNPYFRGLDWESF